MNHLSTPAAPTGMASSARWLGGAGLIPQILFAGVAVGSPAAYGPTAIALALSYAALILSFIGGAWWGLASHAKGRVPLWIWLAAVAPSLIALAAMSALIFGRSPQPGLLTAGAALIAALAVDAKLTTNGLGPPGWLRLRTHLSLGLGWLTIIVAMLA